ncbi:hypothetical protein ABDB91_04465 [Desulfoscipio sp. XC116]|uniref:hypothetical protein n=1 Tax=Desulfoscipio sp. XC116 TaxID=3144975 RepID=UPI00325B8F7C
MEKLFQTSDKKYLQKTTWIAACFIFMLVITACSLSGRQENKIDPPLKYPDDNEIKTLILQNSFTQHTTATENDIKVLKIKEFQKELLVLVLFTQEENYGLTLFEIGTVDDGYKITSGTEGEYSISMGFSANMVICDNTSIVFGDLRSDTWVPETDTRKKTGYTNIKVILDDGKTVSEDVSGDAGYIIILGSNKEIDNMNFYNERGETVNILSDIGGIHKVKNTVYPNI